MALSSMTGFAGASGSHGGLRWAWEIKSVNGKSLDLRLRLPSGFDMLEQALREEAAKSLKRGALQATLQLQEASAASGLRVNEAALEAAIAIASNLAARLGAPMPGVEGLLSLPGVVETGASLPEAEALEARNQAVLAGFRQALAGLHAARRLEGEKLKAILEAQVSRIEALTAEAAGHAARAAQSQLQRLQEQVSRLFGTHAGLDPQRLHQEAVLLATRADVAEELDRLQAHAASARQLLASPEPSGRKLDFLSQEFNREANTLCSKSSDTELTRTGLELKAVIDQFREQVQNLE